MRKLRLIAFATIISVLCGCSSNQQTQEQKPKIPAQYNLMDHGRATKMPSQGLTGSCWAHASINTTESSLITSGLAQPDIDLSEAHLTYYMHDYLENYEDTPSEDGLYIFIQDRNKNSYAFDVGGEDSFVIGAFSIGMGPVPKSEAPLQTQTRADVEASADALKSADQEGKLQKYMGDYLLKGAHYYDIENRDTVKTAIMENGAMNLPMYNSYAKYYSTKHYSYYYPTQVKEPNHEVSLIGWDDTYPKENFETEQPQNDGAWLVLDSAAFGYGSDGYLWISYEDPNLTEAISYKFCKRNTYGDILYYDAIGTRDSIVTKEKYTTIANVFQINETAEIKAVGIHTLDPNRQVEISIYTGVTDGIPDSGDCQTELKVTPEQKGYHVIDLEKTIPVPAGESCSVVVKYCNDDGLGKAPVEGADISHNYGVIIRKAMFVSEKGQSYAFSNGEWFDLSEKSTAEVFGKTDVLNNACIKLLLK